jgi:hypothetical protein
MDDLAALPSPALLVFDAVLRLIYTVRWLGLLLDSPAAVVVPGQSPPTMAPSWSIHIGQGRWHGPENPCQRFERAHERRQGFRRDGKELASGVGHLQQESDRVRGECGSIDRSNGAAELDQVIGGFGRTLFVYVFAPASITHGN